MKYEERYCRTFKCSNLEELTNALNQGRCFRKGIYYYFLSLKGRAYGGKPLPKDVVYLRYTPKTSRTTVKVDYFKFVPTDDENEKVYFGKELQDLICTEMKVWTRNFNPQNHRIVGGGDFRFYLDAIPDEVFFEDGFVEKVKSTIKENLTGSKWHRVNVENVMFMDIENSRDRREDADKSVEESVNASKNAKTKQTEKK